MKEPLEIRSEGPSLGPAGLSVQHLPGPIIEPVKRRKARLTDAEYNRQIISLNLQVSALRTELNLAKGASEAALKEVRVLREGDAVALSLHGLKNEIVEVRKILHRLDWMHRLWIWATSWIKEKI